MRPADGGPAIGERIGKYEVIREVGRGSTGTVYLSHDPFYGRDVAIKVLPPIFTSDAERLARFEREARVLAALNHPNIAHIHGLAEADGVRAFVMELVEGPTLADRVVRGPIPMNEALPIAKQIAEALEAAHEHGIIHRDLKPANIKVRPDGIAKVLETMNFVAWRANTWCASVPITRFRPRRSSTRRTCASST